MPTRPKSGAGAAGPSLDLVIELARNEDFAQLAPVSESDYNQRAREELVTRFFAYGDGLENYHDKVSPFLFDYAKRMNDVLP